MAVDEAEMMEVFSLVEQRRSDNPPLSTRPGICSHRHDFFVASSLNVPRNLPFPTKRYRDEQSQSASGCSQE